MSTDGDRRGNRTFRPDPNDYEKAQASLHQRGRRIGDFLRACVAWLLADPDAALAALAPHWPPPRPRGWRAHRERQQRPPDTSAS